MRRKLVVLLVVAVVAPLALTILSLLHGGRTSLRIARATPSIETPRALPRATAQVAISPDGDGRSDEVRMIVRATNSTHARLLVWTWGGRSVGWSATLRTVPVPLHRGRNVVRWRGRNAAGNPVRDRAYVATLCEVPGTRWKRALERRLFGSRPADERPRRAGSPTSAELADPAAFARAERAARRPPWVEDERCVDRPVIVRVRRLSIRLTHGTSVAPGDRVGYVVDGDARKTAVLLVRDGRERQAPLASWVVTPAPDVKQLTIPTRIDTGLYHLVATLPRTGPGPGVERSVPLIVRNRAIALDRPAPSHTALVVWNSLTWQAYSTFDGDGNGRPDSWYQLWSQRAAPLDMPLMPAGWEHGHGAARHFSQWLWNRPNLRVQSIADRELESLPQSALQSYAAIVFPGHTEYVTRRGYDAVFRYVRAGGDTVFLSANSLYRFVRLDEDRDELELTNLHGTCPTCFAKVDGTRSDHRFAGFGYSGCCFDDAPKSYRVTSDAPVWLLAGTGLRAGDRFGVVDDEVDAVAQDDTLADVRATPVASSTLHNSRGAVTAQMSLTTIDGGGEVFTAGNFAFLDSPDVHDRRPVVSTMLDNLWHRMVG